MGYKRAWWGGEHGVALHGGDERKVRGPGEAAGHLVEKDKAWDQVKGPALSQGRGGVWGNRVRVRGSGGTGKEGLPIAANWGLAGQDIGSHFIILKHKHTFI